MLEISRPQTTAAASVRKRKRVRKPWRSALKTGYRVIRGRVETWLPQPVARVTTPLLERFDLYCVDHGVLRALYLNRHAVDAAMWRAAQLAPRDILRAGRDGIRTIINLRGERDCGSYRLERAACEAAGITLVDFPLRSRGAPTPQTFAEARSLFETIAYPALMHCKSGADRAGLMAALYLLWRGHAPEDAARQLSWRYGHIAQADTGILDHVLALHRAAAKDSGADIFTWAATRYDRRAAEAGFRPVRIASFLTGSVLRRE